MYPCGIPVRLKKKAYVISCAGELVPEMWAETTSSENLTLAFPRSQLVPRVATNLCGHIYKEHLTHKNLQFLLHHHDTLFVITEMQ